MNIYIYILFIYLSVPQVSISQETNGFAKYPIFHGQNQVISFRLVALAAVFGNVIFQLFHFDMRTLVRDMIYVNNCTYIYIYILKMMWFRKVSIPFVPQVSL